LLTGATGGMTLYTHDADASGKSTCNGPCAASWPPLTAETGAKPVGKYTIVTRDDGSLQWAYDGKPLYFWKNDKPRATRPTRPVRASAVSGTSRVPEREKERYGCDPGGDQLYGAERRSGRGGDGGAHRAL
jgi:hypothetical protein